jgi:hypothetical protein
MKEVRAILKQSAYTGGYITTVLEKRNERLGDGVSVALLKIYGKKKISKSENIHNFLPAIRRAFQFPDLITYPNNRVPTVTFALLKELESNISDPSLKAEIAETRVYVEDKTRRSP